MLKYFFAFIVLLGIGTALFAQNPRTKTSVSRPPSTQGWSKEDRNAFLSNCLTQVSSRRDSADAYCLCMLQKLEARYAAPADAKGLSVDTINVWARQCVSSGKVVRWNNDYRKTFLTNCQQAFLKGQGRTEAQAASYCSCMLKKEEAAYPNPLDAYNPDPEKMKAWAKDCLKQ